MTPSLVAPPGNKIFYSSVLTIMVQFQTNFDKSKIKYSAANNIAVISSKLQRVWNAKATMNVKYYYRHEGVQWKRSRHTLLRWNFGAGFRQINKSLANCSTCMQLLDACFPQNCDRRRKYLTSSFRVFVIFDLEVQKHRHQKKTEKVTLKRSDNTKRNGDRRNKQPMKSARIDIRKFSKADKPAR